MAARDACVLSIKMLFHKILFIIKYLRISSQVPPGAVFASVPRIERGFTRKPAAGDHRKRI
jgi:hypothetical protein